MHVHASMWISLIGKLSESFEHIYSLVQRLFQRLVAVLRPLCNVSQQKINIYKWVSFRENEKWLYI